MLKVLKPNRNLAVSKAVDSGMLSFAQNLKIFRPIVQFVPIFVVNIFPLLNGSTNALRGNKSVFSNIKTFSIRVIFWGMNPPISLFINISSKLRLPTFIKTFLITIFSFFSNARPILKSFLTRFTFLDFYLYSWSSRTMKFISTSTRTKTRLSYFFRMPWLVFFVTLITKTTLYSNHNQL